MSSKVYLLSAGVLAPTGADAETCFRALLEGETGFSTDENTGLPVGLLSASARNRVDTMRAEIDRSARLDECALWAATAARSAVRVGEIGDPGECGVVVGSSRGVTGSFEKFHARFLATGKSSAVTSPATTGVAVPAAVAGALGCRGPALYVSSACQTGLTALGVACSLIQTGQARRMVAGGVEASVTPFTLGALDALKILSHDNGAYPLKSGEPDRDGTVLSEGASVFLLAGEEEVEKNRLRPRAEILAFAQAGESTTLTGVTEDAEALRRCVERVLRGRDAPDLVVGHLPGTVHGDAAESAAYEKLFGGKVPVTGFKWSTGHMLAASPCFSLAMALECMERGVIPGLPYVTARNLVPGVSRETTHRQVRTALVTGLGFGGGASALLVGTPG